MVEETENPTDVCNGVVVAFLHVFSRVELIEIMQRDPEVKHMTPPRAVNQERRKYVSIVLHIIYIRNISES